MESVGAGKSTAGSKLIIEAADKNDPRPLWVSVWGGANTLAQALHDASKEKSERQMKEVLSRLKVYRQENELETLHRLVHWKYQSVL